MNNVEKDRFIRRQLDIIDVVDNPPGHEKLQIGDRVYIHRFYPLDSDENGFDATVTLDESTRYPTVILVAEEWAMMTLMEAAWEGYMAHILHKDDV